MKVILDFDDVLFNAKAFKELMFFYLEEKGARNARDVYKKMREMEEVFSMPEFLSQLFPTQEEQDEVYKGIMTPAAWMANKEVLNIIQEVGKDNIFIVSHGNEAFQRDKIERALGDSVLLSHVVVVPGSKADEVGRICAMYSNEDIIFVDDKVLFLNDLPVSDLPNLKTVLFNQHGIETLRAEISESRKAELHRGGIVESDTPRATSSPPGPKMH